VLSSLLALRGGERSATARALSFAAPLLVTMGMAALLLDLSYKLHFWRFYLAFQPRSPMSWGAWILLLVYPVTLLFGLAALDAGQLERLEAAAATLGLAGPVLALRRFASARERGLARLQLATGVALGIYTGILLSSLGARALWSSALLGPLFLASGLSTGAAFLLLFRLREEERQLLVRWDLWAIAAEGAVLALLLAGLSTSGAAGHEAAGLLLGGPFTSQFWTLVVIAGLLAPAAIELLESRFRYAATAVAPVLVLCGGLALRWILVAAGQA
jgi:protein NrfD